MNVRRPRHNSESENKPAANAKVFLKKASARCDFGKSGELRDTEASGKWFAV
jgi:hypothetical protein